MLVSCVTAKIYIFIYYRDINWQMVAIKAPKKLTHTHIHTHLCYEFLCKHDRYKYYTQANLQRWSYKGRSTSFIAENLGKIDIKFIPTFTCVLCEISMNPSLHLVLSLSLSLSLKFPLIYIGFLSLYMLYLLSLCGHALLLCPSFHFGRTHILGLN